MPILFPRPFAFAVDDLGWNDGSDLTGETIQGPHRAGVKRVFDIRDYQYLVEVGKAVGVRIQCLFILSEMDRENVLAKFPTTTYQRDRWENRHRVNQQQIEIMEYVREQAAYMEFGLHGTGHEYWPPNETQKRAEWYNRTDKKPWPEQSLREHLQCFKDIMAQYGFTPERGHSFPESFVPCAYSYYWNPGGNYSLGKLLTEVGVKYANTDFSQVPELNPPQEKNGGGFDYAVHVVNRINYGNPWYQLDCLPTTPLPEQETDIIESHWPNWLAQDDFLQPVVTQKWIDYYKYVQRSNERYIAKNTEQFHSQWLYKKYTLIAESSDGILEIDNMAMPDEAYLHDCVGNLTLKIKLNDGQHVSNALLNGKPVGVYFEEEGFGFLSLPPLKKTNYTLAYSVGSAGLPTYVLNDGTYNIYDFVLMPEKTIIELKLYGHQTVKVKCEKPTAIISNDERLVITRQRYFESGFLEIDMHATDMQGVKATIEVMLK